MLLGHRNCFVLFARLKTSFELSLTNEMENLKNGVLNLPLVDM